MRHHKAVVAHVAFVSEPAATGLWVGQRAGKLARNGGQDENGGRDDRDDHSDDCLMTCCSVLISVLDQEVPA